MADPHTFANIGLLALVHTHATTLPDISIGHVLGQTIIALIVIVGGLWAVGKLYARNRSGKSLRRSPQTPDALKILSRQSLGKDQQLAVVMWGDRKILIGISGSNISFYNDGVVDDAAIASAITDSPPTPAAPLSPFGFDQQFQTNQSVGSLLSFDQQVTPPSKSIIERLRDATQRN